MDEYKEITAISVTSTCVGILIAQALINILLRFQHRVVVYVQRQRFTFFYEL